MKNSGARFVRWVWIVVVWTILATTQTACSMNPSLGGGQSDVITLNDIAVRGLVTENAYEVVQRLRPRWLRRRGASFTIQDAGLAVVYLNGTRYGHPDLLRQIRADEITTIRFLSGTDATTRFGLNHDGGAILVSTGP